MEMQSHSQTRSPTLRNRAHYRVFATGEAEHAHLLATSACALDLAKGVFPLNRGNRMPQDGVRVHKIGGMAQTRNGHCWPGAQGGLLHFEGDEFFSVAIDSTTTQRKEASRMTTVLDDTRRVCMKKSSFWDHARYKFFTVEEAHPTEPEALATVAIRDDAALGAGSNQAHLL
jgi:hypothetical protein